MKIFEMKLSLGNEILSLHSLWVLQWKIIEKEILSVLRCRAGYERKNYWDYRKLFQWLLNPEVTCDTHTWATLYNIHTNVILTLLKIHAL